MVKTQYISKQNKSWRKAQRALYLILICLALVLYLIYWCDRKMRPVILRTLQYECRQLAYNTFTEAADACAEQVAGHYRQLYSFRYDPEGNVEAVIVDAYAANYIQTALNAEVTKRLRANETVPLEISIGSLSGVQYLMGRGPNLKLSISPESYIDTEIYNSVESAGINQTKLSLYVRFTMNLCVSASGYSTTVQVTNDQYLGEVLILGDIPQAYVSFG